MDAILAWFDFIHVWPIWSAKVAAGIIFGSLLLLIWVPSPRFLSLSFDARWKDLRLWATLLILVQALIYAVF